MNLIYGLKVYSKLDQSNTKTEAVAVKGRRIVSFIIFNPSNATAYVQFFDALAADVTVGTTAPKFVVGIPTAREVVAKIGPISFDVAITIAATTTATGSTAPSAALQVQFVYG